MGFLFVSQNSPWPIVPQNNIHKANAGGASQQ
jgi:hypothetical protein